MRRTHIAIVVLYGLVYLAPLGLRPLVVPSEAQAAGTCSLVDRISQTGGDEGAAAVPFGHNPGGLLLCKVSAISVRLLGRNAAALRLPSALAAGLTALLLFGFLRRCCWDGVTPPLTAAVLLTSALFFWSGTTAGMGGGVTFLFTSAMLCLFLAFNETGVMRLCAGGLGALSWALSVFVLGPQALLAGGAIAILFVVWEQHWRNALRAFWFPALVAAVILVPEWGLWFRGVEGGMPAGFLSSDNVSTRVLLYAAMALPWALVLPITVREVWLKRDDVLVRFSVCWFAVLLLLAVVYEDRAAVYLLAALPPFAILTAFALFECQALGRDGAWGRWIGFAGAGMLAAGALLLVLNRACGIDLFALFASDPTWKLVTAVSALLVASGVLLFSALTRWWSRRIRAYALAPVPVMLAVLVAFPDVWLDGRAPGEIIQRHQAGIDTSTCVIADRRFADCLSWFAKPRVVLALQAPKGRPGSLEKADAAETFREHVQARLAGLKPDQKVAVILDVNSFHACAPFPTKPLLLDASQGFVYAEFSGTNRGQKGLSADTRAIALRRLDWRTAENEVSAPLPDGVSLPLRGASVDAPPGLSGTHAPPPLSLAPRPPVAPSGEAEDDGSASAETLPSGLNASVPSSPVRFGPERGGR